MAGITIRNLSKSYGEASDKPAVKNVNIAVPDGTFLTLLGPSGCGKTTTLRLIAGYITPDAGEILVGERQVSSAQKVVPPESRGMGMVFQNYAIWPHKTVYENVAFGLKIRRLDAATVRQKVEQALDQVNLVGYEKRYPNELSGGQQQRVALARSLVVEPDILLLDEPLSNLDAKLREKMRIDLKALQRRTGITFVYVTHDQAEALALSDQIVVMHQGEVEQIGTPFEVYEKPASRRVADFMGLVNAFKVQATPAEGGQASLVFPNGPTLLMPAPAGLSAVTDVDLIVRPENIRLEPVLAGGQQLLGTVTSKTFMGNLSELFVSLPTGEEIRVQTHPLEPSEVGQQVALVIDPATASIFLQS
jgi:iron(III) transport system ATP-binding protein